MGVGSATPAPLPLPEANTAALEEGLPFHWVERGQAEVLELLEVLVELPKLEGLEELASLEEVQRRGEAWRTRGLAYQSRLEEEVGEARSGNQEELLENSFLQRCWKEGLPRGGTVHQGEREEEGDLAVLLHHQREVVHSMNQILPRSLLQVGLPYLPLPGSPKEAPHAVT